MAVKLVDGLVEKIGEQENKTVEKTEGKTVEKILQAIREHSKTSIREIQIVTDLTRRGVKWNLRKIKSEEALSKELVPRKVVTGKLLISKISLRG